LVGTANCEVIEIDEASGSGKLIVQGHSSGEVWGLSCHPSKDIFVTGCDDKVNTVPPPCLPPSLKILVL
jgi:hypothetical protein